MRHVVFIAITFLITAATAAPASAEDEHLGWTFEATGSLGVLIANGHIDAAACIAKIEPWQAPNEGGWAASMVVTTTEKGRISELLWNRGHGLPAKVKGCLNKEIRKPTWPHPRDDGRQRYMVSQSLLLITPVGGELEWVDAETTEAALTPHAADLQECFAGDGQLIRGGGRISLVLSIGPSGEVEAAAITGGRVDGNRAPITRANCVSTPALRAEFPRAPGTALRLAAFSVSSKNWYRHLAERPTFTARREAGISGRSPE